MNRDNKTYKRISLLLLAVIISHLFVHYELEEKVLCIGDGDHIQIENISDSHLESDFKTISHDKNCVDYLLDNHIDEDYAKNNRVYLVRFDNSITHNFEEYSKPKVSNNLAYKLYLNQKYTIEQLPTVTLLI